MSFKQLLTFRLLQLLLYLEKNCKVILIRILHRSLKIRQKPYAQDDALMRKQPLKNWKILFFLAPFISKLKIVDIFNVLSVKYFGKGLLFLKIRHIRVKYCWSYRPSNLLFRFFRYRLGHLDNRQTKIAENSIINFFES